MGSVKGEVQRGTGEQPEIDAMLEAKAGLPIREQQGDRAFYSPLADYIVVAASLAVRRYAELLRNASA